MGGGGGVQPPKASPKLPPCIRVCYHDYKGCDYNDVQRPKNIIMIIMIIMVVKTYLMSELLS